MVKKLRQELDWFSSDLIEILPAAVYVCDADAVIVAYNRRAAELWGRAPELGDTDLKYCGSAKLFHPDGTYLPHAETPMAVVLQTLIVNWDFVGGSRGAYIIRPEYLEIAGWQASYIEYLFVLMLMLAVFALATARTIERSQLGFGFATIRDDELAAEACGVPTLRLKLIATTLSGAFMGMAGAPFPYYIGYLQPSSAFGLEYAVNSIAMPMIGGTTSWVGPLIGAILLGSAQQYATVTISSAVNLLIVGLMLVAFVIIAPNGLIGLVQERLRRRQP